VGWAVNPNAVKLWLYRSPTTTSDNTYNTADAGGMPELDLNWGLVVASESNAYASLWFESTGA